MSIVPWDFQKKKGLAIIVGSTTDCISAHVAMLLGSKRVFSDDLSNNINSNNGMAEDGDSEKIADINSYDIIYFMGQGSLKKHTINTKTMKYIADELYDAGYRGKQTLYITSCYAKALTRGMSTLKLMVSYLKKLFGLKSNLAPKTSMLNLLREQLGKKGVPHDKIQSDFDGLSITVDNNGIQAWNVKVYGLDSIIKEKEQKRFLEKNDYLNIHHSLGSTDIDNINHFKIGLIQDFGGDIMDTYWGTSWWESYLWIGGLFLGGLSLVGFGVKYHMGELTISSNQICSICILMLFVTGLLDFILIRAEKEKFSTLIKLLSLISGGSIVLLITWSILNVVCAGWNFGYIAYKIGMILIVAGIFYIFIAKF